MAKAKTQYSCTECGAKSAKWLGQCTQCEAWNSIVEEPAEQEKTTTQKRFEGVAGIQPVMYLDDIEGGDVERIPTDIVELDRVLGGGFVEGGVVLIGGDPGIGKSTLLLQASERLAVSHKVLYVSGEESGGQIAMRARRIGIDGKAIRVMGEINLEKVIAVIKEEQPKFIVIDSINVMWSEHLSSAPGTVGQIKECASTLTRLAKTIGVTVVLVGHMTKDNQIAGPQVLSHLTDAVLEMGGDPHSNYRLLRATKNRFGPVPELGLFHMSETGLKCVSNPSALFMSHHDSAVPGSAILASMEGTRPLLVEIQALVDSGGASPRRLSVGLERDRLAMLLAVMNRHCGIQFNDQDVFVNAVGGVKISEPAADLGVMLALQSSLRGKPLQKGLVVFGEVGLAGEARPAPGGGERLKEAAKLGMCNAIIPLANVPKKPIEGLTVHGVRRIEEAIEVARSLE